jgi:DnaJ-domain-containing protein 1
MAKKRTAPKSAVGPWWVPVLKTGLGIAVKTAGAVLEHLLNQDDHPKPLRGAKAKQRSASPRKHATRAQPKWWKVLGVPENATSAEIKAAFRAQMILTHPDKVAHLSKTLQRAAEREAKKLNRAYAEAMRVQGE